MNWGWRKILADRRGATAVEYGLILAVIVLVMFGALQNLAGTTTAMWTDVSQKVRNAS
jgi:pilus assembly protein Flp/PilA